MDLILASSNHSVESFSRSKFDMKDEKTGQIKQKLESMYKWTQ